MQRVLSNNIYMLRFIARSCPSHIVLTICLAALSGVTSILNVFILKLIVDSLSSPNNFERCIIYILLITVLDIFILIIRTIYNSYILPKNEQTIRKEMRLALMNQAISIEFSNYDDQVFYNKFSMAIAQSDTRALAVLNTFSTLFNSLFGIGAFAVLLIVLNPVLIMFAILGAGTSIIIQVKAMKLQHKYSEESIPIQRQMSYIQRIIYQKDYVQEINLNPSAAKLIEQAYHISLQDMFALIKKYAVGLFCTQSVSSGISSIISAFSLIYLVLHIASGQISLGDFVALESSSTQLFNKLRSLAEGLFKLYDHNLYIENFREFMDIPSRNITKTNQIYKPESVCMSLQGIGFSYPHSSSSAVQDINLDIKQGDKIALVGSNGSGKTTLIKLILGMYTPSQGQILVNNVEIKNYDYSDYLSMFGVVLQDFRFFSFSIAENILMRPVQNKESDENLVWSALSFVKLADKVAQLPEQIHTPLYREFSNQGVVFSGGELQRLAVARAFAKDAPILILDEPSSALDPIAEAELADMIFTMGADKTVILITHRLDNLKYANRILVMENGKIVEDGEHEGLLAKDGVYTKLVYTAHKTQ